jgi:hypothetical protein
MQPPIYCPAHIYTLIVSGPDLFNETESYQQLFTPTESTMVARVTPDNLQDNSQLIFKVLIQNSLTETLYETGATIFCKSHAFFFY